MELKAITPVVALVILLLITTGLVGVSYAWFNSVISASVSKAASIPPGGAYCSGSKIKVYVLNNGDTNISAPDIVVADVDGFSVINNGLVGYWKFDEGSGSTAFDSSGNTNNGNLKPSCPDCPQWLSGKSKTALKFDGTNDYVDLGTTNRFLEGASKLTISSWTRPYAVPAPGNIFTIFASNKIVGHEYVLLALDETNKIYFWVAPRGDTNWRAWRTINPVITTVGFQHVAAIWDGTNTLKIYYNGIEQNVELASSSGDISGLTVSHALGLNNQHIGSYSTSNYFFNGIIDDVRIYNRALLPAEIKFLYGIRTGESALAIDYPTTTGRHNVRIGTSSGVVETGVTCA